MTRNGSEPRFFYGWVIVGYVVANAIILSGVAFLAIGVFIQPLEREFGWSRASISAAFSNSWVVAALMGPVAGRFVDKYGVRPALTIGLLGMAATFAMLSRVESLWQLHAVLIIGAVARPFASFIPTSVLLSRWFVRKRATTLGFVAAGYSIGGLLVPLVALVVDMTSFRGGFLFNAVLIAALVPAGLLVIRERPADRGLEPDGGPGDGLVAGGQHSIAVESESTLREALHTPAFWYLALAFTLLFTSQGAFLVHAVPFFESAGRSTATATLLVLALTTTTGVLRAGLGMLVDRAANPHRLAAILTCTMGLAMTIVTLNTSVLAIAAFMPLWAIGMAGGPVFEPLLFLRTFGAKNFGQILGALGVVEMVGTWGGPVGAGFVFDQTGSYRLALAVGAFIFVGAALFFVRAGRSARARARAFAAAPAGVAGSG